MQVYLPSALTGGSTSSDPKIRELNNELNEVNRKILNNDLEIPPEGERSPSPEPIYDRNGEYSIAHACHMPCKGISHIRSSTVLPLNGGSTALGEATPVIVLQLDTF